MSQNFCRVTVKKRVDLRNVFEVAGSGKGLDVLFEGHGGVEGYPKVADLRDREKHGAIDRDRSGKGMNGMREI